MLKYELDPSFIKSVEDIDKLDLTTSSVEVNLILSELKQFRPWCFAFNKVVPVLQRLTINKNLPYNNNETITDLKLLKNPPLSVIKQLNRYGRANLKDQTVLYASFIFPTLIMKPDLTLATWSLFPNGN